MTSFLWGFHVYVYCLRIYLMGNVVNSLTGSEFDLTLEEMQTAKEAPNYQMFLQRVKIFQNRVIPQRVVTRFGSSRYAFPPPRIIAISAPM